MVAPHFPTSRNRCKGVFFVLVGCPPRCRRSLPCFTMNELTNKNSQCNCYTELIMMTEVKNGDVLERRYQIPLHPRLLSTRGKTCISQSGLRYSRVGLSGVELKLGARYSYTFFRAHAKICVFSWPARIDELFLSAARRLLMY